MSDTAHILTRSFDAASPARVRKFFPETWIWSELNCTAQGGAECVHSDVAPDTILYFVMDVLCMGFSWALYFCQSIMEDAAREAAGRSGFF